MDKITDVKIQNLVSSEYMKPSRMIFKQNGVQRFWDLMKIHDSVAIVIYNVSRNVLVFVKQFRPAIYYASSCVDLNAAGEKIIDVQKYPPSSGITLEFCAGIVDKDISLKQIAQEEMLEECGYKIDSTKIEFITSYRSSVGLSGSFQHLYYAEVTDNMKVSKGGGNVKEGEYIQVVEMTIPEAQNIIFDSTIPRPVSMLFGLMWFFSKNKIEIKSKNV